MPSPDPRTFDPNDWLGCLAMALILTPASVLLDIGQIDATGVAYWLWRLLGGGLLSVIAAFLWYCVWTERDVLR